MKKLRSTNAKELALMKEKEREKQRLAREEEFAKERDKALHGAFKSSDDDGSRNDGSKSSAQLRRERQQRLLSQDGGRGTTKVSKDEAGNSNSSSSSSRRRKTMVSEEEVVAMERLEAEALEAYLNTAATSTSTSTLNFNQKAENGDGGGGDRGRAEEEDDDATSRRLRAANDAMAMDRLAGLSRERHKVRFNTNSSWPAIFSAAEQSLSASSSSSTPSVFSVRRATNITASAKDNDDDDGSSSSNDDERRGRSVCEADSLLLEELHRTVSAQHVKLKHLTAMQQEEGAKNEAASSSSSSSSSTWRQAAASRKTSSGGSGGKYQDILEARQVSLHLSSGFFKCASSARFNPIKCIFVPINERNLNLMSLFSTTTTTITIDGSDHVWAAVRACERHSGGSGAVAAGSLAALG
jgi:hypothetical protein